ncbi:MULTISPECIES: 3-carboxy-cis,cis-muconate cycloisomerase [unclassified Acinetobacter]|uniref:3-carboxy-cis,cis-muconate cycloisomerase n=1 Tax=unclassified Acinetobacter TaxID=196816 RepID=UPI0029344C04|nr:MULTISPECIES: 3-carboxy-cis,cis-muconate cycloisomerase [unclassified Acinetobacter]WOE32632.1 3-carboxy-cis,cis-muconate cycloisomerase [Acinetobacter sp. SAAs470]WOE38108.1 3-carboxy-cis,cis-muconate cycloisomerase [Acinetobacter sp. SAAs474]
MSQLYASLFYQDDVTNIFSDQTLIAYMIEAEVALAQAQAQVGVIPQSVAVTIAQVASTALEQIDFDALAIATALAGNIAIPFVKQFTAIVQHVDAEAAGYVHWGATSQDILDTACILQCRAALQCVEALIEQCYQVALRQAQQYRSQVMIGRTWLQQGLPITLGHKFARWASVFYRDLVRIAAMKERVLTAQLGGAVGSLASLQSQGSAVVHAYAAQLQLSVPTSTWHAERDRMVEIASVLAMVTGSLGKMARDWSLMMQTEIAEVFEPTAKGRGGSSTMPHKRNPVAAASILAAANRVPVLMSSLYQSMVQEHERSLGSWHAEWLAIPEIFQLCAGALQRTLEVLDGIQINPEQMQRNLDCTQGLVMAEALMMALAPHLGRLAAHHLIESACQAAVAQGVHLSEIVMTLDQVKAHFNSTQILALFQPDTYLGNIQAQIDAVLQEAKGLSK